MKRAMRLLGLMVLCELLLLPITANTDAEINVQVGVAKVDVTPREPVVLAGYGGRTKAFDGIDSPLWARSLVIGGEEPAVIVVVDNCGIRGKLRSVLAQRLSKRNISEETCEKLKIYRDGDLLRFHYFTKDGVLRGAKVKTKNKVFTYEGENPGTLWMEHLWPDKGKRIVITEGEIDAASVFEVLKINPRHNSPMGTRFSLLVSSL